MIVEFAIAAALGTLPPAEPLPDPVAIVPGDCVKMPKIDPTKPHKPIVAGKKRPQHGYHPPRLFKAEPKPPEEEPCEPLGTKPPMIVDLPPVSFPPESPEPAEFPRLTVWPLEPEPWEPGWPIGAPGSFYGLVGYNSFVPAGGPGLMVAAPPPSIEPPAGTPSTFAATPVPEPSLWVMLGLGLCALPLLSRRS